LDRALFVLDLRLRGKSTAFGYWDNAVAESFFKTIKHEWLNRFKFTSFNQLVDLISDYMNWYNNERLHKKSQ